MIEDTLYIKQADLLLDVIPFLRKETDFALKGGTAINFFVRNLPRLSVDIDLTYLVINQREDALREISEFLLRLSDSVIKSNSKIKTKFKKSANLNEKLYLISEEATIKIEPNLILRGSVYPVQILSLCDKGKNDFEKNVNVQSLSTPDLYGSKICAALDRQHPRDLFDVKLLLENEGLADDIRKAFIIYLISHPRPISELLNPNLRDIKEVYENEFTGMTNQEISYQQLLEVQNILARKLLEDLTAKEKQFILSFKNITPDWNLLDLYKSEDEVFNIERIKTLPAVKWKMLNLKKMDSKKHTEAYKKLENLLNK
jgi:predicted nucleotidyltransferase component of viral defense system